jgi:hypothetical protein
MYVLANAHRDKRLVVLWKGCNPKQHPESPEASW